MIEVLLPSNPDQSLVGCNGSTAMDLVMDSNNSFRKIHFGMELEWTDFIYGGEEDIASLLHRFKKSLMEKFDFPYDYEDRGHGHREYYQEDDYIFEAELAAEVLGDMKEKIVPYSALELYWRFATQLGYNTGFIPARLNWAPEQYRNVECIRLLAKYG